MAISKDHETKEGFYIFKFTSDLHTLLNKHTDWKKGNALAVHFIPNSEKKKSVKRNQGPFSSRHIWMQFYSFLWFTNDIQFTHLLPSITSFINARKIISLNFGTCFILPQFDCSLENCKWTILP